MGHGRRRNTSPSKKAVDGNVDPVESHHHCAFVQNLPPLPHSWLVDLGDLYAIDKIILHASGGEYM